MAVIRIQTADPELIDRRFIAANGMTCADAAPGRILYGHWGPEDLVVVRTEDNCWEIHCHGGNAAVDRICRDLQPTAQSTSPPDLAGRLESLLSRCRTRRTAEIVLSQMTGILADWLHSFRQSNDESSLIQAAREILQYESLARHLVSPWRVAIVGRPNAGKSSLLNAFMGFERAIVFDQPGTTRDLIEADLFADGWPLQLVDTAGIRSTTDAVEVSGVSAARASLLTCDACLLVIDSVAGWHEEDDAIRKEVPVATPTQIVWNKSDLLKDSSDVDAACQAGHHVSATSGEGVPNLLNWLTTQLVPIVPPLTTPMPLVEEINAALKTFLAGGDLKSLQEVIDCWS